MRAEAVRLINAGFIALPGVAGEQSTENAVSVNYKDVNNGKIKEITSKSSKVGKPVDVLSFNDFHGNLAEDTSETGKNVGVAKLVGAIKAAKASNENTIVVSGGDNYQGSAMSNLTHGAPVSAMMKSVGVVASSVGNHEFDWGMSWISKWAQDGNFDFLAANIYDKTTGQPVPGLNHMKSLKRMGLRLLLLV